MAGHAEHQASIDSDVEDEFEQFIEEIEDFLMKQDMGEPLDEEERWEQTLFYLPSDRKCLCLHA